MPDGASPADVYVLKEGPQNVDPMVYIAGPITGNPFGCVREALPAFRWLLDHGCVPFMPQLSVIAEMIEPMSYEDYLAYDFGVIRHCEALLRLPGDSPGADREWVFAAGLGLGTWRWDDPESMQTFEKWLAER